MTETEKMERYQMIERAICIYAFEHRLQFWRQCEYSLTNFIPCTFLIRDPDTDRHYTIVFNLDEWAGDVEKTVENMKSWLDIEFGGERYFQ